MTPVNLLKEKLVALEAIYAQVTLHAEKAARDSAEYRKTSEKVERQIRQYKEVIEQITSHQE